MSFFSENFSIKLRFLENRNFCFLKPKIKLRFCFWNCQEKSSSEFQEDTEMKYQSFGLDRENLKSAELQLFLFF